MPIPIVAPPIRREAADDGSAALAVAMCARDDLPPIRERAASCGRKVLSMRRVKGILLGCAGLALASLVSAQPAAAQYGWRGYDGYDRYDRYDRRYDRDRGRRYGRGPGRDYVPRGQPRAPVIVNPRRNIPGGNAYRVQPGPYGGYAVPVQPGNEGRYGNPNN